MGTGYRLRLPAVWPRLPATLIAGSQQVRSVISRHSSSINDFDDSDRSPNSVVMPTARWQLLVVLILTLFSGTGWTEGSSSIESDRLVQQQIRVTGRIKLATDYIFRGVSQTDEGPAIQGAIDAQFPADIYAGIFLTNVDKPWGTVYSRSGGKESFEFDTFVGLNRSLANLKGNDLYLDLGLIHYGFESDPDDLSWSEAFVDLAWGGLSARYSSRIAGAPMGDYFEAALEGEIKDWFHYRFHIGRYSLDRTVRPGFRMTAMARCDFWIQRIHAWCFRSVARFHLLCIDDRIFAHADIREGSSPQAFAPSVELLGDDPVNSYRSLLKFMRHQSAVNDQHEDAENLPRTLWSRVDCVGGYARSERPFRDRRRYRGTNRDYCDRTA